MPRQRVLVLILDSAMLALVCVLECLDLTGLELHEWLGFALCPLVLLHVIWQWPWLVTQFRKFRRARGARVRVNALLNAVLLVLMSAVLLSGVLNSSQSIGLVRERFGSILVWREMHNWLNFTLLLWVALHLGLNWDWILGIFSRRMGASNPPSDQLRSTSSQLGSIRICGFFRGGLAALAAIILSAGLAYFAMKPLFVSPTKQSTSRAAVQPGGSALPRELLPQPRSVLLPHGFEQLSVTCGIVVMVVLVAHYVFRLRL